IAGMVEEFLRERRVEQERIVDHEEIHIGDAPIRIPKSGYQKRQQHAGANQQQLVAPGKQHQAIERHRAARLQPTRMDRRRAIHRDTECSGSIARSSAAPASRARSERSLAPSLASAALPKRGTSRRRMNRGSKKVTMPSSTVAALNAIASRPMAARSISPAPPIRTPPTLPKYTQTNRNGNAARVV